MAWSVVVVAPFFVLFGISRGLDMCTTRTTRGHLLGFRHRAEQAEGEDATQAAGGLRSGHEISKDENEGAQRAGVGAGPILGHNTTIPYTV